MFKRMMLALTFIAALGAASVGTSSKAMAYGGCRHDGYGYGGYGGYGAAYGYRTAYYPTYYPYPFAPRVAVYPPVYPVYYGGGGHHHRHHHNHHRDGVSISFGF